MTLLVRDEEHILEKNLRFHKAMGVDGFIITDNNSTDGTAEIIDRYKKEGWVLDHISEDGNNYDQVRWVNRMILMAKEKYQADWVINADADELWFHPSGSLKNSISYTNANVLECPLYNMVPEDAPLETWTNVVKSPLKDPEEWGLSRYSIYGSQSGKVIHRTTGYREISMGNHLVDMQFLKKRRDSGIRIYHYPVQSYKQFKNKIFIGGRALENNPNRRVGVHCRYLYKFILENRFEEEFARIVGKPVFGELCKAGAVERDNSVADFFRERVGAGSEF